MLGTNDAMYTWDQTQFEEDYTKFLKILLEKYGKVYLMIPPPLYCNHHFGYGLPFFLNKIYWLAGHKEEIIMGVLEKIIRKIAEEQNIPQSRIISAFEALGGHDRTMPDCFYEKLHPNDKGYKTLAEYVYKALKDD